MGDARTLVIINLGQQSAAVQFFGAEVPAEKLAGEWVDLLGDGRGAQPQLVDVTNVPVPGFGVRLLGTPVKR